MLSGGVKSTTVYQWCYGVAVLSTIDYRYCILGNCIFRLTIFSGKNRTHRYEQLSSRNLCGRKRKKFASPIVTCYQLMEANVLRDEIFICDQVSCGELFLIMGAFIPPKYYQIKYHIFLSNLNKTRKEQESCEVHNTFL